ncbi:MAG TPA: glycosyltransferase family 2 protein [Anaerolineaceae bacterium]|nr:glycosyltransferase family 2 protein [Anaerolineaceae bacterium]
MNDFPRVSIITPSFNQVAYLEQTLQSVLGQGYPNLEYIVVDGGSTDGSVEIIQKYAGKLAWWVSEKDHGQAEAINRGFTRATGEIIAWLNSDDLYLPGAIAGAVRAFRQYPDCGLVFSDVHSIDESGQTFNIMRYTKGAQSGTKGAQAGNRWQLEDLMAFNIIGQPGVFMRRAALEQAGYLDLNYHYLLDHHLWLRVAQIASIQYVSEEWAAARIHAAAKNVAHAASFGEEAYRIVEWMQTDPGLAPKFKANRRRILAGAHRFNARYLLDGGQAWPALRSYTRSLFTHPPTALKEWKRMLYCFAALVGLGKIKDWVLARRKRQFPQHSRAQGKLRNE